MKKLPLFFAALLFSALAIQSASAQIGKKLKEGLGGGKDQASSSNVYVTSKKVTHSGGMGTKDVETEPVPVEGPPSLYLRAAKGMSKGSSIGRIGQFEDLTAINGGSPVWGLLQTITYDGNKSFGSGSDVGRVLPVGDNKDIFIFYTGQELRESGYKESSPLDAPKIAFVMAKTEDIAKEWDSEKGMQKVLEFEAKLTAKMKKVGADYLASVRMPKPGKLHTPDNVAKAEKIVKEICVRDGTPFRRLVVSSDEWAIIRNPNTGIIIYRVLKTHFVDTKNNGECMIQSAWFRQDHDGKDFSGPWKIEALGQDPNYGPMIDCDNINK